MVVIITLNFNQNDYTLKCVESILKSKNIKYHILLIDNGSTKENVDILIKNLPKSNNLTLKKIEKNIGYVGGINYGLKEGLKFGPNYFLIMNNDTIIDKNAIYELVNTCKDYKDEVVVSGKVYHYDDPTKLQDIGHIYSNEKTLKFKRIGLNEIDNGQYNIVAERDMLDDVYWLFSINVFKKIGNYSSYFWFNAEQADYALRAKKEGFKLIYTPKARLWHKGSVSIGGRNKNPKLAYWNIQSSLILRYIHLSKWNFSIYFLSIIKSVFFTTLKSIYYNFKGDRSWVSYSSAKRKALIYFLKWTIIKNENTGVSPF